MNYHVMDLIVHPTNNDPQGGIISAATLDDTLNKYGTQGWTVKFATATGHSERGTHWAILLEKPLPTAPTKA